MRQRVLGSTGISVSQVGLGTWPIAGSGGIPGYGAVDPEVSRETIRTALRSGITLFDTADVYGNGYAESLLGEVLEPVREKVVICTKGGWDLARQAPNFSPDFLRDQVSASLRRLRTRYIDVYLLHSPPAHLVGVNEIYLPLRALRKKGIIRHVGVSVRNADEAILALDLPEVEVIQLPFSLLNQDAEWGLFRIDRVFKVGIIVREALANGLLTDKYSAHTHFPNDDFRSTLSPAILAHAMAQISRVRPYKRPNESIIDLALRFVLDRPEVSSVVVGARNSQQVMDHLRAGDIVPSPKISSAVESYHQST